MRGAYVNNAETEEAPATAPVSAAIAKPRNGASATTIKLARRLAFTTSAVTSCRSGAAVAARAGPILAPDGRTIRDRAIVRRLARLAVPPAYADVLYAEDPAAHLQAIGRDAAGRLQYRYHSEWEKVREIRKASAAGAAGRCFAAHTPQRGAAPFGPEPTREFALAAVIELVACSAIRPGSESYARQHGTRGATTLLKSNVTFTMTLIRLTFTAKGGQKVVKEVVCPRLSKALEVLRQVPGRRLFQYRTENGSVRPVKAQEVNAFLRQIAGVNISLKDFRTLMASASVLEALARATPAKSERQRRKQVLEAVRAAAENLAQHASDLPPQLRTRYGGRCVRGRSARAVLGNARRLPFAESAGPSAGPDHRRGGVSECDSRCCRTAGVLYQRFSSFIPPILQTVRPFRRCHWLDREAGIFHQRHVLQPRLGLDRGERHRLGHRPERFHIGSDEDAFWIGRVRIGFADHLNDADDPPLGAGMVEEGEVALLHLLEMLAGGEIAHAGPRLALGAAT